MYNMNKKGVSSIIANILIILLVIAMVGTLSSQILKLINNPTLSPENNCQLLYSKNIINLQEACYNPDTKETEIKVRRNSQEPINKLTFFLNGIPHSCGNTCGSCHILQEGTQTYYFDKQAQEVSLFMNNCFIESENIRTC
jgi:hypothetical protein